MGLVVFLPAAVAQFFQDSGAFPQKVDVSSRECEHPLVTLDCFTILLQSCQRVAETTPGVRVIRMPLKSGASSRTGGKQLLDIGIRFGCRGLIICLPLRGNFVSRPRRPSISRDFYAEMRTEQRHCDEHRATMVRRISCNRAP